MYWKVILLRMIRLNKPEIAMALYNRSLHKNKVQLKQIQVKGP